MMARGTERQIGEIDRLVAAIRDDNRPVGISEIRLAAEREEHRAEIGAADLSLVPGT